MNKRNTNNTEVIPLEIGYLYFCWFVLVYQAVNVEAAGYIRLYRQWSQRCPLL